LANPELQPETLFGAELGADYITENGAIRVTAFRNDLHNLILNATLSSTPTSILRERENGPNALGRGFEISADHRWREFTGVLGYLYADSVLVTGTRIPEVPRSSGSATLRWAHKRTLASASVRALSSQFDDDLNQFLLPGFASVEILVRQQLVKRLSASLEVTNLLNKTFYTGFTPYPTIGDPRIARGGLIWKWN
jgi:outer membrane cobalamin receptor